MLCAPLDWQYAELLSSASDAVLCSLFARNQIEKNIYIVCLHHSVVNFQQERLRFEHLQPTLRH